MYLDSSFIPRHTLLSVDVQQDSQECGDMEVNHYAPIQLKTDTPGRYLQVHVNNLTTDQQQHLSKFDHVWFQ